MRIPDTSFTRMTALLRGALTPPPGARRIALALGYGATAHLAFGLAGLAMVGAMYHGMTLGLGTLKGGWAIAANAALILQFPLIHSFLLTAPGQGVLARLAPRPHGATLGTTSYVLIASIQIVLLFSLWSPSGTVWWEAEGVVKAAITLAYAASWALLAKATYDSGIEVQSGALGWLSLVQAKRPVFPDMPEQGLFRIIRHPIYVSFALTTWTVPVWTPDQLAVAVALTAYCLFAPILKERRSRRRHGARFDAYRAQVPYAVPRIRKG